MEARRPTISETELDVMKALWELEAGTVRQVNKLLRRQGRRWAYTTVLTLLQRLEAKGYAVSDKSGVAHVFRPAMSRDKLLRQRLKDLSNQLCEGTATPLMMALVEAERLTAEEIDQFRQLLDRLESKRKKD